MEKKITYFSAFSGYGGFELGIQQSNAYQPECVGFSEIDSYAIQVYKKHFPKHINYGNISKIKWNKIPDFDLLTGGSPCQDFSIAGKRKGIKGDRSGLIWEFIRALREKKPKYFIWENVKGTMSSRNGFDFASILVAFSESGYDLQWEVLNAKNFGVPQNRERVFIVGYSGKEPCPKVFPFGGTDEKDTRNIGEDLSFCIDANYHKGTNTLEKGRRQLIQLNNPTHSNDRVYSDKGISPTLNTMQGGRRQPFIKIPEPTKKGYAVAERGDSINLSIPNSKTRRGRVGKRIAQTLDTGMQQHTITENARIRRLTCLECERLMNLPDNWLKTGIDEKGNEVEISDSQRYKLCGNGVVVSIVKEIIKKLKN